MSLHAILVWEYVGTPESEKRVKQRTYMALAFKGTLESTE